MVEIKKWEIISCLLTRYGKNLDEFKSEIEGLQKKYGMTLAELKADVESGGGFDQDKFDDMVKWEGMVQVVAEAPQLLDDIENGRFTVVDY